MDPDNFMSMFGPYEDDYEWEEQNRKNIREYSQLIRQNALLTKQVEVMIKQIEENNRKKSAQVKQRIAKMQQVVDLQNNSRIGQRVYKSLVEQVLQRAAIVQANAETNGQQLSAEEILLIERLKDIHLQQEKNFMRHQKLQENFGADSKEDKEWKELAEKEKKLVEAENLLKTKRAEFETLKKERDYVKKQTEERQTYLRKEIDYYDNLIKEKKGKQEMKAKLLADIDAVNAEIEAEKAKIAEQNPFGAIEAVDSQDSEAEFAPIVFKDPNDFPLLSEYLRSPSQKRVSSKSQKAQQKAMAKIAKKTAKGSHLNRKKTKVYLPSQPGPSTSGNSISKQRSHANIHDSNSSKSREYIHASRGGQLESVDFPKERVEKEVSTKAKKAHKSNDTPKKVTFADNFEKPDEVIATPPTKKTNEKPITPKPKELASKVHAVKSLAIQDYADSTPKGPQKKIVPKSLAQKPPEQKQTTPEVTKKNTPTPMEVDRAFEPQSSDDEAPDKQQFGPKESASNESIVEFDIIGDDRSVDFDSIFNTSGSVSGSKTSINNAGDDFDFDFLDNPNAGDDFNVGDDDPFASTGAGNVATGGSFFD